jgi:hypothetical protein
MGKKSGKKKRDGMRCRGGIATDSLVTRYRENVTAIPIPTRIPRFLQPERPSGGQV